MFDIYAVQSSAWPMLITSLSFLHFTTQCTPLKSEFWIDF
jgi:hypothetical protein